MIITSIHQRWILNTTYGYVFNRVWTKYLKVGQIQTKMNGRVGYVTRKNQFDFGEDPDQRDSSPLSDMAKFEQNKKKNLLDDNKQIKF